MAFLIVDQPEAGEIRLPLERPRVSMGRSESNDLCLAFDAAISRKHAEIVRKGNGFVVLDLGSRHGTLVNGVAVQGQQELSAGDRIQVGHTVVTFMVDDDSRLATLPETPGELDSMHTVQMSMSEALNTTLEHQPSTSRPGGAAAPQSRAFAIISQAMARSGGDEAVSGSSIGGFWSCAMIDSISTVGSGVAILRCGTRMASTSRASAA